MELSRSPSRGMRGSTSNNARDHADACGRVRYNGFVFDCQPQKQIGLFPPMPLFLELCVETLGSCSTVSSCILLFRRASDQSSSELGRRSRCSANMLTRYS